MKRSVLFVWIALTGASSCPPIVTTPQPQTLTARAGEIFAEVYASQARLEQIRMETSARGWLVDCFAPAANPEGFLRIQMPTEATYADMEYFVKVRGVSKVQMVYEGMPKFPCPA